jgi:hypothetical protein
VFLLGFFAWFEFYLLPEAGRLYLDINIVAYLFFLVNHKLKMI